MAWYTTDYCTLCCRHIPVYSWYYHSYTCHRRTVTSTSTSTNHGTSRRSHSRHRREHDRERDEYEYETTIRRTGSRSRHGSTSYYCSYLPWRYHHRPATAPAPAPVRCPTPAPPALPEPLPCRSRSSRRRGSEDTTARDKDRGWRRRTVDIYIEH